jgi:hypothetical protein
MIPQSANAALQIIKEVAGVAQNYSSIMGTSKSLVDLTKPLRVEPYTLVDSALTYVDFMPEVLQSAQSIFTGYWLLAVDMISSCQSARALSALDQVNPSRDANFSQFADRINRNFSREALYWSAEAYKFGLPTQHSWRVRQAAQEAAENGGKDTSPAGGGAKGNDTLSKSTTQGVHESANLSVGKLVSVKIGEGDKVTEVRAAIRLFAVETPGETFERIVADKSEAGKFKERLFDMNMGRIGIMDLITCRDLVKERKRQLLRDKNGVYGEVRSRVLAHKRAGLATGQQSAAEASNICVLSSELCNDIQSRYGLDIDDFGDRSKIFENLNAMLIVRVDRNNLRVTFFHDGIRAASAMGVNDIRIANKKQGGPDVMDIFNALKEGNAPRY